MNKEKLADKPIYFGSNLRFLRLKREMSQPQLAEMLGYKSYISIQHLETGRNEPSVGILKRVCDIFNVPISMMLFVDMKNYTKEEEETLDRITDMILSLPQAKRLLMYNTLADIYRIFEGEKDAESGKAKIGKIPNQGSEDIERTQD